MKCEKCKDEISQDEERESRGMMLCEDCYMDALSPAKVCDPWAVFTAKSLLRNGSTGPQVNETQAKILGILKETGGLEPPVLLERLGIKLADFEREFAALRHMEMVRAEMREGKKFLRLW